MNIFDAIIACGAQERLDIAKAMDSEIEKGKSFPVGTIHNGFKKVSEGKWQKVSESHGLTREEHNKLKLAYEKPLKQAEAGKEKMPQRDWLNQLNFNEKQAWENYNTHFDAETRLDDKEYSDEEVHSSNKKTKEEIEDNKSNYDRHQRMLDSEN